MHCSDLSIAKTAGPVFGFSRSRPIGPLCHGATKSNRKSHLRNFLQYGEYVVGGLYRDHLKLTSGLLVLNVTRSEATMAGMLKLARELSPSGNTYQLFQYHPPFGRQFKPPKPLPDLLAGPWGRAGRVDFRIDQLA